MALAALALACLPAPRPEAQEATSSPQVTGIELTPQAQQALDQIRELWLQWLSAYLQNDADRAESVVTSLLATVRQLGFERLPDLSFGAEVRAVEAARDGDFERAAWALASAEALDPGRPEQAFAAARVAQLRGSYPAALIAYVRGYVRLVSLPTERRLWSLNLVIWTLAVLLLAGAVFLALEMAVKGGSLYRDLVRLLDGVLPSPVAHAVALAVLAWPLLLPSGWLWLMLYWSVLLWGYGSPSERAVFVGLWLLLGLAPLVIAAGRERVALDLSPPVKAMESVEQRRLYGALFSDLGALRSMLPESPAVPHLLADFHRILGQWDLAATLYRQLLRDDPEMPSVLVNLGAYHYYKNDFGTSIEYFRRATEADAANAVAYYNLSQALLGTVSYFDESRAALDRARQLDEGKVSEWMKRSGGERIVLYNGGLARIGEIRGQLAAAQRQAAGVTESRVELLRRGLAVVVALGAALLAVAIHLGRRGFGYSEPPIQLLLGESLPARVARALAPGLGAARVGEGGRAFAAVLLPVALLMLPIGGVLLFRLPWGYDPGTTGPWTLAALGLAAFLGTRVLREVRREV